MTMSSAVIDGSTGSKDEPFPKRTVDAMSMLTGPSTRMVAFFPGVSARSS
jgi:hypothetical protein